MKHVACALVVFMVAGLAVSSAPAQIPRVLSYQGVLTDTASNPKPDGSYSLTFRLFGSQTGGSALWTETKTLAVERGLFSTALGDVTPFGPALRFDHPYWLSIQVASQPQMSPRVRLTSVGYSLNSIKSDTALYALSAPPQAWADSARVSEISHTLHLPATSSTSNSAYGVEFENQGTGDGIRAYSKATNTNYAAVYAVNNATTGSGKGVYGYSTKGVGVYAGSQANDGIEAVTSDSNRSAVYSHSVNGVGLTSRSSNKFGGQVGGGGDNSWSDPLGDLFLEGNRGELFTGGSVLELYSNGFVVLDLDEDNNSASQFEIWNGTETLVFKVDELGNTFATGTKSALVHTDRHGDRLVYATESPEVWLEDIGAASLRGGSASVEFEEVFAQTISTTAPYHVFVTPTADQPVMLFVSGKSKAGFTVKGVGLDGRPVDCAFDYRVVAKRRGYESVRLAPVDPAENSRAQVPVAAPVRNTEAPEPSPIKEPHQ